MRGVRVTKSTQATIAADCAGLDGCDSHSRSRQLTVRTGSTSKPPMSAGTFPLSYAQMIVRAQRRHRAQLLEAAANPALERHSPVK